MVRNGHITFMPESKRSLTRSHFLLNLIQLAMQKIVDSSTRQGGSGHVSGRNHPVLKGIMQVLFIIALILLVFAVKFKG